jgi:gluconate kinase
MNPALLKSQLETLEEPDNAIVVDAGQKLEATVDDIVEALT